MATKQLTKRDLPLITELASIGLPQARMAKHFNMSPATFKLRLKEDQAARKAWEKGRAAMEKELGNLLMAAARKGDKAILCFMAKCVLGYRESGKTPD